MFKRMKEKGIESLLQNHPASRHYVTCPNINELGDLLERLLNVDPSCRPDSIQEILEHPYLSVPDQVDLTYCSQSEAESEVNQEIMSEKHG